MLTSRLHSVTQLAKTAALGLTLSLLLSGCQESVAPQTQLPQEQNQRGYGGSITNEEVRRFKNEVWTKLRGTDRCGSCHVPDGAASTPFVRQDDINAAHEAALAIVNTESPEQSLMVTKVAEGHQCWLGSNEGASCAAQLVVYLRNWLYPTTELSNEEVKLERPTLRTPDTNTVSFPTDPNSFQTTVWPILVENCASCHADNASLPIAPFFAQSDSADIQAAYDAAKPKMDLNNIANSRVVVRLREEFHNCWSGDCASDAAELQAAVQALADSAAGLNSNELNLVAIPNSKALYIHDGTVASGGGRVDSNLIALYKFDDGEGDTLINDTSGIGSPTDLQLYGTEGIDYRWLGGWGIEFLTPEGRAQATPQASAKLYDMITTSGEYTLEAWLIPANVTQGADDPSTIISYSTGTNSGRNFTLRQRLYNYDYLNRSSATNGNGELALSTRDDDEAAQTTLQHIVATFDPINGRRLYVNGELVASLEADTGANLTDWDSSFMLMLGNESLGSQPWSGSIRFLAIHSRALTPEQVGFNFDAGVGERYFLLFNIDDELAKGGLTFNEAYIMLEVARFDTYSYLFANPTFISLDENFQASDIPAAGIRIKGIRIGINGREPEAGQAYVNLDTLITEKNYGPRGQQLSELGTILALESGPERDEFFLTFEQLNSEEDSRIYSNPVQPFPPFSGGAAPDIGLRTFDEINATMAVLTGVDPTLDAISGPDGTYTLVKQQLPSNDNIGGFVSAHQVGIAQLAIEYCHILVEEASLSSTFFPGFNFDTPLTAIDSNQWESDIIAPLIDRFVASDPASVAQETQIRTVLRELFAGYSTYPGLQNAQCNPDYTGPCSPTRIAAKASCAALLGSAVTLIQ